MRQAGPALLAKKLIDKVVAVLVLIFAAPVMGILALLILWKMGRPVLFRQERPGLRGRIVRIHKFRTMSQECDNNGQLLPDELRLTWIGNFLRATSLDELPQMYDVLRGAISLVGPRPLLPSYLPRYTQQQARRHDVMPGITGWAQINGRNALTWEKKFEYDVWYVDHWSLWLDTRIMLRTAGRIFHRSGITHSGSATMPEYLGQSGERECKARES